MSMPFLFKDEEEKDIECLYQGDILSKTDQLKSVISQAHPYYSDADSYHYFMVLTQSCDLIRRKTLPKTEYITLAAVRPLNVLLDKIIERYDQSPPGFPYRLCDRKNETQVKQILEKLLHNTYDNFFFLRKGSLPFLTQDYCVFLPLTIALRKTHYEICLNSKLSQLNDVFQAKLGWLTGNLYSRVATPDFEEHQSNPEQYKKDFFEEALYENIAWISPQQKQDIDSMLREKGAPCTDHNEARDIIARARTEEVIFADRVSKILVNAKLLKDNSPKTQEAVINALASDKRLKTIIKQFLNV